MRKELEHFNIGGSYGGNQDWFRTFMMRIGGCGAETACDSSLYFALHKGIEGIYPFDAANITRSDYVEFAHMMEEYLWPRMSGIDKLDIYAEGYANYLKDRGISEISMDLFSGNEPYDKAAGIVISQINSGCPIPTLILNHKNRSLKDYVWHWFLLNGYDRDETTGRLLVKAVTYSEYQWLDLEALWDTGHDKKGGFIIYRISDGEPLLSVSDNT